MLDAASAKGGLPMKGAFTRAAQAALSIPGNVLIASASQFLPRVRRALRGDISIASRFIPHDPGRQVWTIPLDDTPREGSPLPVPPRELRLGYGRSADAYLASGRRDVEMLERIVEASRTRLADCRRILDLGCGAGRMVRWLVDVGGREIWGADVSADHILWCEQHLSPPFRFVTTTSCPHLPFEDGYFDLVYAGSVFTHISELAEAWLLEIRRIMQPDARAYLTVHDRNTVDFLLRHPNRPLARRLSALPDELRFWTSDFGRATLGRGFGSLVFYDDRFIRRRWGRFFDVLSITPEAYDCQTAVLLAKGSLG